MAAAPTAAPPLPPDVTSQQAGVPLSQYADMQQQGQGQNRFQQSPSGSEMVEMLMNEIADKLDQVAKVVNMSNPAMMEYVKKIAQVGGEFMKEIQAAKQKQQSQGMGPKAGLEPRQSAQPPQEGPPPPAEMAA